SLRPAPPGAERAGSQNGPATDANARSADRAGAADRRAAWRLPRARPDRPGDPLAGHGRRAGRNPAGWNVAACVLNRALVSSSYLFRRSSMVLPRAAGESDTAMPARFIASILSLAVPVPPEMIAPAWPMRRPGGAVEPAMKPTIGFLTLLRLTKSAA